MAVQKLVLMPIWEWCKKPNIVAAVIVAGFVSGTFVPHLVSGCLLYTSDAADD